jgi:hypothetical protein
VREPNEQTELTRDEARALRLITDEVRSAQAPELDWDRLEQSLLQRVEREAAPRRVPRIASAWSSLGAFAAAAAAVVLLIASSSQQNPEHGRAPAPQAVELAALPRVVDEAGAPAFQVSNVPARSVFESGREALRFVEPGVATWTLEADSRAVLVSAGLPHVVSLERGTVHADVVPRESANELVEAFVVEAGGARVAVHGTVFTVERFADSVAVEVTRGSVTIGPAGHRGATTGHLLVSPARASFDLANGRFIEMLPMREPVAAVAVGPLAQASTAAVPPQQPALEPQPGDAPEEEPGLLRPSMPHKLPPASSAEEEPVPPSEPEPAAAPILTVAQARGAIGGCLAATAKHDDSSDTVVTVSTTITLALGDDGTVNSMRFSPPLKPELQSQCAGILFGKRVEGSGSASFQVTFQAN